MPGSGSEDSQARLAASRRTARSTMSARKTKVGMSGARTPGVRVSSPRRRILGLPRPMVTPRPSILVPPMGKSRSGIPGGAEGLGCPGYFAMRRAREDQGHPPFHDRAGERPPRRSPGSASTQACWLRSWAPERSRTVCRFYCPYPDSSSRANAQPAAAGRQRSRD